MLTTKVNRSGFVYRRHGLPHRRPQRIGHAIDRPEKAINDRLIPVA